MDTRKSAQSLPPCWEYWLQELACIFVLKENLSEATEFRTNQNKHSASECFANSRTQMLKSGQSVFFSDWPPGNPVTQERPEKQFYNE